MEDAVARQNFCSNCVPRLELDQRARDARLSLVKVERLLVRRVPRRRFQLVRVFVGRLFSERRADQTPGSLSGSSGGSMPGIDPAGFDACRLARSAA